MFPAQFIKMKFAGKSASFFVDRFSIYAIILELSGNLDKEGVRYPKTLSFVWLSVVALQ